MAGNAHEGGLLLKWWHVLAALVAVAFSIGGLYVKIEYARDDIKEAKTTLAEVQKQLNDLRVVVAGLPHKK